MKIKLGVLFGGKSVEHEVSIISALQAAAYLDRSKYDVVPIYMTKKNEFYIGEEIGKIESYRDGIPQLPVPLRLPQGKRGHVVLA